MTQSGLEKRKKKLELKLRLTEYEATLILGRLVGAQGSQEDVWTRLTAEVARGLREAVEQERVKHGGRD